MTGTTIGGLSSADQAAIRALTDRFPTLLVQRAFAALGRLYTEDAVVMPPNQPAVFGRTAFESWVTSFPRVSRLTLTPAEIDGRADIAYVRGEFVILVSTTVIEVGVDVPNASVMIVEHAERFGLSQLHQLRGRVGRGAHKSYCILLYQSPLTEQGRERLKALTDTSDGFEIAERDLQLRGPGDFFGTRQSGMPTLRAGDLLRDHAIMEDARREAVQALDDANQTASLMALVNTSWEQRFGLVGIG